MRSYTALLVFAIIAYNVNVMLPGANYLYLARPESAPSVLDILPPQLRPAHRHHRGGDHADVLPGLPALAAA